jgi:hypothetical protein
MFEVGSGQVSEWDEPAGLVTGSGVVLAPADEVIPPYLDDMTPGPFLGAILSGLDRSRLSGHDLITVLKAETRMVSYFQALAAESMVGAMDRSHVERGAYPETYDQSTDEIRAALHLTRRSADIETAQAHAIRTHPQVWEALRKGEIDLRRARVIVEGIGHLPPATGSKVVDQVITAAPVLTTGELRARIARLAIDIDPESARSRYEETVEDRRVFSEVNPAGSANLMGLDLDLARTHAARSRINAIARSLKTADETRTLDQIRADVFLDLLCGTTPNTETQGQGNVNITVDLATLADLADKAGEIPGVGSVIADIARETAYQQQGGIWTYQVTDQGRPVATGTTSRRPTTSMRRHIQANHPTCVFPGCRMPAAECDIDHHQRWEHHGQTIIPNLGPVCRHDHQLLDHDWTLTREENGDHTWISPLGHTYTKPAIPP